MAVVVRNTFLDVPDHKFLCFDEPCHVARRCHSVPCTWKPDMPVSSLKAVLPVRSKRRTLLLASNSSTQSDLSSCPSVESLEALSSTADDSVKNRSEGRSETCNRVGMAATRIEAPSTGPAQALPRNPHRPMESNAGFPTQASWQDSSAEKFAQHQLSKDGACQLQWSPHYVPMFQMPADTSSYTQACLPGLQESFGQTGHAATYVDASTYTSGQTYANGNFASIETMAMYGNRFACDTRPASWEVVPAVSNHDDYSDLWGRVWRLSKDKNGCMRVQDMIKDKNFAKDHKSALVSELKNYVGAAWKHSWGNFVLTCALEYLPRSDSQFIVDEMLPHVSKAAKHRCGVRVVQKILEFGEPEKAKLFVEPLFAHASTLCTAPEGEYGVYAILHLMEHALGASSEEELDAQKRRLLNIVLENLTDFATDTWAPLVIMKLLTNGGPETRDAMLNALLSNPGLLATMASEPKREFGLKAAKEALEMANAEDKLAVVDELSGAELSDFLLRGGRFGTKFIELVKDLKKQLVSSDGQK